MIGLIWYIALLGSQFYFFSSGTPQPSHFIILFLLVFYFFNKKFRFQSNYIKLEFLKIFSIFLFYVFLINIISSIYYQDFVFLKNSIFWLFSYLLAFVLLIGLDEKGVQESLRIAAFSGIILLIIFWFFGLGRYNYGSRFNGYFNDPNQMAFWVLCSFCIYFYLTNKKNNFSILTLSIISLFVVFTTFSRSALLGIGFIILGSILRFIGVGSKISINKRILYILLLLSLLPVSFYFLINFEITLVMLDRFSVTDFGEQADLRGYGRPQNYPEFLLFGAGQGLDSRFMSEHEIHSSWVAIFFYYGLIGLTLFIILLWNIFSKLDIAEKLVFFAPMFYGISTYGLRSPIFWFFIASAIFAANKNTTKL